MAHVAESTHWYTRAGEPAYTVVGANGKERPTTLRDARKCGYPPGVSGIIKCAAAQSLEHWKQEQILLAALTLPRDPNETEEFWLRRVWADSREQSRKAAERGTAIHAAVQGHFEGEPPEKEYAKHVRGAVTALEVAFPDAQWQCEKSFAHPLGFGGKVDLHSAVDGAHVIVDIKTKEFGIGKQLDTYDEQHMQLAAYAKGLHLDNASAGILYVSASEPGLAAFLPVRYEELYRGWTMFEALLAYWKAKNKYDSAF